MLGARERHIFDSVLSTDEILVGLKGREEAEPVLTKRLDDLVQMLRFKVLERFGLDQYYTVFIELGTEHNFESFQP